MTMVLGWVCDVPTVGCACCVGGGGRGGDHALHLGPPDSPHPTHKNLAQYSAVQFCTAGEPHHLGWWLVCGERKCFSCESYFKKEISI